MKKTAQIWISTVIWVLIGTMILALLLSFGLPVFKKTKEKVTYQQVVTEFQGLKQILDSLATEGPGAQRIVELSIPKGEVQVKPDAIIWKTKMEEPIIEPMSRIEQNGVIIASDADVSAYDNGTHYILENSYIKVVINHQSSFINVSDLIDSITLKLTNSTVKPKYNFFLLNDPSTAVGNGKITLLNSGTNLVSSTVLVEVNSTKVDYSLYLTLYSKADFIRFKVGDVKVKS